LYHGVLRAERQSLKGRLLMKVYGLTGGIASGKSSIAGLFEDLGATLIDADAVARDVVEPGQPAYTEILETFGEDVAMEDGGLDRRKLRRLIFSDPKKRDKLNQIVHPKVLLETGNLLSKAQTAGSRIVIYEAALIVEIGLTQMFEGLIVMDCKPDIQIKRLMSRDKASREDAIRALGSQADPQLRLDAADYVIDNNGTLAEAESKVQDIWAIISNTQQGD